MTVDVRQWRDFRFGDLFRIVPAKGKNSTLLNDGDDIAYIAASKENNGFNRMVSVAGFEDWVSEGNCLQLVHIGDAAAGYCNYIHDDFIAMSGKSSCAYNDHMNEFSGLFIASVIQRVNSGKYSFKESWTGQKVLDTVIKLPVTPDGEPDWAYMEHYMRDVMAQQADVIDHLARISKEKHPVPMRSWGGFRVGELFEIKYSKVYHTRQLEEVAVGLPYVTRGQYNNGLKCYVKDSSRLVHNPAGVISFGAEGSAFFYQRDEYVSGRDMYYLDTRHLSEEACLFVVSCLSVIAEKYSYTNGMFPKKVADDFIKLPVTESGEPDWAYMEDYMRNVMDRQAYVVDCLKKISARKAG